jgi:hypothetical protein
MLFVLSQGRHCVCEQYRLLHSSNVSVEQQLSQQNDPTEESQSRDKSPSIKLMMQDQLCMVASVAFQHHSQKQSHNVQ